MTPDPTSGLLYPDGRPIPRAEIARLREEVAGPSLIGVRPVISGHPAEGLTPAHLAAIHRAAAQGDSLAYMELAEDIEERDLHYAGVLGTRKRQVAQLPLTIEAVSDDAEHVRHKDFLAAWLRRGVLDDVLLDLLDAVGKGFAVAEIMWEVTGDGIVPVGLIPRPQRWFEVSPQDGSTIMLRETGGLVDLAAWKFVVHRHPGKSGLIIRSGLARLASWGWMYKAFTVRDWQLFVQNYGMPIRIGKYGPESSEPDRRVLWRAVSNIAGDCAAIIPKGMEIEFIENGNVGAGSDLYLKRVDWCDHQVSKAVLGQTTTTDAISGGHAVAREHRLVQEDIERHDARLLAVTISRQLFAPIIAFNFPGVRAFPTARIGRPDEVPLEGVVDALYKLGPLGLEIEASELRDRLGFSEPSREPVDGRPVALIGGRAAPPAVPTAPRQGQPAALLHRLVTRHAAEADPEVIEALVDRTAQDSAGALAGLTDQVRAEIEAATDLQDLAARLARLQLDPQQLGIAMGQAMAIAHLAGQAALLDEMRGS